MLDIQYIRDNAKQVAAQLRARGYTTPVDNLLKLDDARRAALTNAQALQQEQNALSKHIGDAKRAGKSANTSQTKLGELKRCVQEREQAARAAQEALDTALAEVPNLPLEDVPLGEDDTANTVLRNSKLPCKSDGVAHEVLGAKLQQMDFELAARLAGSRFVLLRGALARLERALGQFMLDAHIAKGYEEISPPALLRSEAVFGVGQLPKFAQDLFQTTDGRWLTPTAEVPLSNLVREQILDATELPLRFTALTPCFRSEAGAAGRDTKGLIRQHQFQKVELVSITTPQNSAAELERMTQCAENILIQLEIPHQVVLLSTGDMGFSAAKTYDLEVWMPAQQAWREISSCSNCEAFQARRMQARYRNGNSKRADFVHTLNGSGVAIGRCLAALLETHYDGTVVHIPKALVPYFDGRTQLDIPA